MSKRISIINFKGGVGKTTLAFNFGAGLAKFHDSRVLLIDMDHQSSLSVVCLGAERWEQIAQRGETIDQIFRPFIGQAQEFPGEEIVVSNPLRDKLRWRNPYESLDILPANLELDNVEIELTGSIQGDPIRSEWNKRTLICRWIEETELDDEYDYIIFDCPPATKIVSQNAIAASHGYVIPVVPEIVMERGAPHLRDMMRNGIDAKLRRLAVHEGDQDEREMYVPETALVGLVVTRIKVSGPSSSGYTNEHTQHLGNLRVAWGEDLIEPYVVDGIGVAETLTDGLPVYEFPNEQNVGHRNIDDQFRRITNTLKERIDEL